MSPRDLDLNSDLFFQALTSSFKRVEIRSQESPEKDLGSNEETAMSRKERKLKISDLPSKLLEIKTFLSLYHGLDQSEPTNKHLLMYYEVHLDVLSYDVREIVQMQVAEHMIQTAKKIQKMKLQIKKLQSELSDLFYDDENWEFHRKATHWSSEGTLIRTALTEEL